MDWSLIQANLPMLWLGLQWTLLVAGLGMILALIMGVLLLTLRRSPVKILSRCVRLYTEIILGLPILVLMFIIFFVLPAYGIIIEPIPAGLLTLMLYYGPYFAEVMRGAINAIPPGQWESGFSVGMSEAEVFRRIVLPQSVGVMIPPLTGFLIAIIKDSAIFSVISVTELTFQAKQVIARTYAPFEIYLVIAVGYWLLNFVLELGMRRLEHRVNHYRFSARR